MQFRKLKKPIAFILIILLPLLFFLPDIPRILLQSFSFCLTISFKVKCGNHSCSGCGDRKIGSLRPSWAKLVRPCLKNKTQTKGLGV
jgi:hypothetical protein